MTLFFVSLLLVAASTLASFALQPQTTYAATTCGWITDKTIRCTDDNNVNTNYNDSNPNDANRTFKSTKAITWCKVAGLVNTITIGSSPASATLFEVTTPEPIVGDVGDVVTPDKVPKVDCQVKSSTISLSGVAAAGKPSTNCEDRPGGAVQACLDDLKDGNAAFAVGCGGPYPSAGTLCTPTAAPDYTKPADAANPTKNGDDKEPDPCDSLGNDFSLRWVMCPILTAATGMADGLDGLIEENLQYDANIFNTTTTSGKGFYQAWSSFRSIALALVFVAGLVMVVSQGSGLQLVDAYTIRKVLPRLLIAVIGITLSWQLLGFIVTFFNDLGHWTQDLILLPFQTAASGTDSNNFAQAGGVALALTAAIIGSGAYLIAIGPLGILSLAGTVVLALLVAWVVLVVRNVVITVLILFAPLAFACYILPNTKKVWDFWQNALITMLAVFPIIMALLAAGKAMSIVSPSGIMKVLFLVAPYFFIPFAFKLAGGLMSTVFSMVNDKGRGGFDRMRNVRANQRKQRFDDAMAGRGNNWVAKTGMGDLARRGQMANQGGLNVFTKKGRTQYQDAKTRKFAETAAKALENDHGRSAGDDGAMALGMKLGMTKDEFVQEYSKGYRKFQVDKLGRNASDVSEKEATDASLSALSSMENGFGAKLGSEAMAVASFKALASSSTGFKPGAWNDIALAAAPLMDKGLMNEADVMSAVKANKARTDLSGVGSSTILARMSQVKRDYQADKSSTTLINDNDRSALLQDALFGSQPGAIVAGRHEAVKALAPEMLKRLEKVKAEGTQEQYIKELAAVAGQYDVMSQVSRQNAGMMDEYLMSQKVDGDGGATVQQMVDSMRGNEAFQQRRREYQQQVATQAQQAQQAQLAAQGAPIGGPPPIAGAPGS